jgi:N-methylhydantoinase B
VPSDVALCGRASCLGPTGVCRDSDSYSLFRSERGAWGAQRPQLQQMKLRTDSVTLEVVRNYFHAIVADMSHTLRRTAYTTYVKETDDFMSGLAAPDGEFFMYPRDTGIVGHVGLHLRDVLAHIGTWEPGDVVIFNDPYVTGGMSTHLPDVHTIKPVFHDGTVIAFTWCFLHSSDVGGMVPASISPAASEIFQEGMRIPPTRLYRRGELNREARDLILLNCRIPEDNWGDIKAMIAALNDGERRIHAMVDKFGLSTVTNGMQDLLDYTEERARTLIARLPEGTYSFIDYLEDDVISDVPIRLKVTMSVRDRGVLLDFTGSDAQVDAAFNLVAGNLNPHPFLASGLTSFLITADPSIPLNGGIVRPIRMHLPRGSVVNCEYPAAAGVRWAVVIRCFDILLGILNQAAPGQVPAAGAGQACIVVGASFNPATGRPLVNVIEPIQGGSGASRDKDGVEATYYSASLKNTPIESVEAHVPVVIRRYELVPDTGGAGRHRGGSAMRIEFQVRQPEFTVQARGQERTRLQPWGVDGGRAGGNGRAILHPGTAAERVIGKINILKLQAGDVLRIQSPGGGGYGEPLERELSAVLRDLRNGLVSPQAARDLYGVALTADGTVDHAETAALRGGRSSPAAGFDMGEARRKLDKVWTPLAIDFATEWLMALPAVLRSRARRLFHAELIAAPAEVDHAELEAAWKRVRLALGLVDS